MRQAMVSEVRYTERVYQSDVVSWREALRLKDSRGRKHSKQALCATTSSRDCARLLWVV